MNTPPGRPETHFVQTPQGFVGYQIFGADGPDIVFLTNWMTNVDMYWDEPSAARYLSRLAEMGRVFLIDKRGSGVSDAPPQGYVEPVEDTLDDVRAVLDARGSKEAVLVGDTEGGPLACVLAATFPQRFPTLILVNAWARLSRTDDYPIGAPQHVLDTWRRDWEEGFGVDARSLRLTAPSVADDARFAAWWPRFQRQAMTPSVARGALPWIAETDVRSVLPAIQSRTLVVQRRDAVMHRLAYGEYLAAHIEGARLAVVGGADTLPFHAGETGRILDLVEEFITGHTSSARTNRMLATVLFSDIVGSTSIASEVGDDRWLDARAEHNRIVRVLFERFRGTEVKTTGDGFLATFDGPHRAIQCAQVMVSELESIGLHIRAGIHTGEIEVREGDIGGLAVNIASRVMDTAESGGIMVSGTVKDLVLGSNLDFVDRGGFELKGVPGSWSLYEVKTVSAASAPGGPSDRTPSPG